jgi:diguanylate cyclase (GGDEF)-like protein
MRTAVIIKGEVAVVGDRPPPEFDLTTCYREPIHTPEAIQPHGAVLAARVDDLVVTHASANLAAILGIPAKAALGRPLQETLGKGVCHALEGVAELNADGLGHADTKLLVGNATFHLHAYRFDRLICIDIEPTIDGQQASPGVYAQAVLETFKRATTRVALCELAVRGLKALTGYDRVLAYRFDDDGHGEVIAEAREGSLEPYLGLRYPASDIPHQARRQYLLQRVGAVADSSYRPVPMLSDPTLHDGTPLDMTHCSLRSISPVHLEYMRNMNTAASLTIGLAHQQKLWGMLVCHHRTPRSAGAELRAAADIIGQVVSLLLVSLGQSEDYAQRFDQNDTLRSLIDRLASPTPLIDALVAAKAELLQLVKAEGAIVRLSGKLLCLGRTPPSPAAQAALLVLHQSAAGEVIAVEDLGLRYPELASCTTDGSGALLLPLPADDAILWFRPELSQNVVWGGNPNEPVRLDPATGRLSPRDSFAGWTEIVRGHSATWRAADLALARELRNAIEAEMAQRTKAELAKLRNYDPLTGLPNRRLLKSRLAEMEEHLDRASLCLVFMDLDRFKTVNDTMGHAAGDALLVQVAERVTAAAGPENMVARLGGDEFVALCQGLQREEISALSERIRLAIEAPFEISGRQCHVSVSFGIAWADELGELDLLRAADMAMYAAKKSGGNQGMVFDQSLYQRASEQFKLENDLREALQRDDQLSLAFQPIFNVVPNRTVVGFEARLRWQHPRNGWLAPGLFVPLAEKSDLVLTLGAWVLAEAMRQGRKFQQLCPAQELRLSVNISSMHLTHKTFCADLTDMLQSENFPASSLCLEVTEGVLADVAAAHVVANIRTLGVHVALDDFGMGYTSLSHLRRLPVDIVKLDRSFLEPSEGDAHRTSFIGAVINLAHAAGLLVIAKGIETPAQLAIVAKASVDNVQGLLLAPPLSAKAAVELLAGPGPI